MRSLYFCLLAMGFSTLGWTEPIGSNENDQAIRLNLTTMLLANTLKSLSVERPNASKRENAQARFDDGTIFLSLSEALRYALEQSPQAILARLEREAQKDVNASSLTLFRPKPSVNASYSNASDRGSASQQIDGDFGVQTAWLLPSGTSMLLGLSRPTTSSRFSTDGGRAILEIKQPLLKGNWAVGALGRDQVLADEQLSINQLLIQRRAIVSQAFDAYFTHFQSLQRREIARRALLRSKERFTFSRIQFDVGRISRLDFQQAQADVAASELRIEEADQQVSESNRVLALLLGKPLKTRFRLADELGQPLYVSPTLDAAIELARKSRPELIESSISVESQLRALQRANNDLLPLFDLNLQVERAVGGAVSNVSRNASLARNTRVGVVLEIPLSRAEVRSAHNSAKISLQRARIAEQEQLRAIESDVQAAHYGLSAAERALGLASEALALQRSILVGEQEKLRSGRLSSFELTNAQDGLFEAERAELDARIELIRSQFRLDVAQGIDLARWLNFGVQNP